MPGKRQQQKSHGKRSPIARAGKTVRSSSAIHQPWQIAVVSLVLAVVTLFTYRAVRSNDFVNYDDPSYVLRNPQIQQGVTPKSVKWAFTSFYAANWHPLTWISHMIDWRLYGSNPLGHHLTNVCLHAANAILLFLLLLYMTGYLGRSAMVAFLFALHPANVESVAWISERKDLLCTFFWFVALIAYVGYARSPSWKRFAWVTVGFACALMSKPMAVTLPFTLLLLDFWPLRRINFAPKSRPQWFSSLGKLCVEKWLLFIMAATESVLAFLAQRSGDSVSTLQLMPLGQRISNIAIDYWRYMRILVWPDPLMAFYYYDLNNTRIFLAVVSAIALILVTFLCWRIRKEKPYCLIGWLWFLGTLVPVIGIVQVGSQSLAERYTYIPSIGIFIAVVWLVADAVAHSPAVKVAAQLLAVAILIACAVKTDAQVHMWSDTVTLYRHVLEIDPRGELPNTNLGLEYLGMGRLADAETYFERSLQYDSDWVMTLTDSAYTLMRISMLTHDQSHMPLARQHLDHALQIDPNDANTLTNLALWSSLMGNPKDEESWSRRTLSTHPDYVSAWLYLGDALQAQGKLDDAAQQYRHVLTIEPNNSNAYDDLGIIDLKQGSTEDALKQFRHSIAIQPNQSIAHAKIGKILLEKHQLPQAVDELTQSLRFDRTNAVVHNDLGMALFQMGEDDKAAEQFTAALKYNPALDDARKNFNAVEDKIMNTKPKP
jgi:tetratricopeptide (TPR) repeat protein